MVKRIRYVLRVPGYLEVDVQLSLACRCIGIDPNSVGVRTWPESAVLPDSSTPTFPRLPHKHVLRRFGDIYSILTGASSVSTELPIQD